MKTLDDFKIALANSAGYDVELGHASNRMLTNPDGSIDINTGAWTSPKADITTAGVFTIPTSIGINTGAWSGHKTGITTVDMLTNPDGRIGINTAAWTSPKADITTAGMFTIPDASMRINTGAWSGHKAGITTASMLMNHEGGSILLGNPHLQMMTELRHCEPEILSGFFSHATESAYTFAVNRNIRQRFEVPLPRRFNDGEDVPSEVFAELLSEVAHKFEGYQVQEVKGGWLYEGEIIGDDHFKLIVDTPDLDSSRRWMEQFTERCRRRLKQHRIYVASFEVHVW
jgi:hypothetical protein